MMPSFQVLCRENGYRTCRRITCECILPVTCISIAIPSAPSSLFLDSVSLSFALHPSCPVQGSCLLSYNEPRLHCLHLVRNLTSSPFQLTVACGFSVDSAELPPTASPKAEADYHISAPSVHALLRQTQCSSGHPLFRKPSR